MFTILAVVHGKSLGLNGTAEATESSGALESAAPKQFGKSLGLNGTAEATESSGALESAAPKQFG